MSVSNLGLTDMAYPPLLYAVSGNPFKYVNEFLIINILFEVVLNIFIKTQLKNWVKHFRLSFDSLCNNTYVGGEGTNFLGCDLWRRHDPAIKE